jgi:hypothetical protein
MGGSVTRGVAIIFLLVFFGAAITLCLQNGGSVNLTLLAWIVETPVYVVPWWDTSSACSAGGALRAY